jgi:lipopolysaccharide transport protein LptA
LCLLALLCAGPAAPAATPATAKDGAGIRIEFGRLTEAPGKILLEQAVITEEDARGTALKTIRADSAESNSLDVSNSTWVFTGHVTVNMPEGELQADRAQVLILRGLVSTATVTGQPANFQQRAVASGAVAARGRANNIDYNAGSGDLVFTGNVWFSSETTGEISSSRATYNIPLRTSSFEKGDNERVHGVIRLKPRSGETEKTP